MAEDKIPKKVHRRDALDYGLVAHAEPIDGSEPIDYHYLRRGDRIYMYREGTEPDILHLLCSEDLQEWQARQMQHEQQKAKKHYRLRPHGK